MFKKQLMGRWRLHLTQLQFLITVLLIIGIFFRFTNIDKKVYWYDETFTSLRISGYTEAEVVQQLNESQVIGIEALQKYQRLNPEKGLIDTIKSLAIEDPQHPPLYYVMARLWAQGLGSSVTAMRSLPAVISLLAFPSIYWLCLELFGSPLIGWMAIALIAVSPFHLVYAQEARQYSLWTVTILISSAALLKAVRLKTPISWLIYAATVALGLYTFLFHGLVAIGHGIYIVANEGFRLSKTVKSYLLASITGFLMFAPWIFNVVTSFLQADRVTDWTRIERPPLALVKSWIHSLTLAFLDIGEPGFSSKFFLIYPIVLIIGSYSIYFLYRQTQKTVWLFILTLIGTTALALMLPDLILGGIRSTVPRYLIPCYLGIQLAVAHLLATKITYISVNNWQQRLWKLVMIALISGGVFSYVISSQAEVWWNKISDINSPTVARIINQTPQPLLISDAETGDLLPLSYLLNPKVRMLVKPQCYTCQVNSQSQGKPYIAEIPEGFSDVFLFKPSNSKKWLQEIEKVQTYKVEHIYQEGPIKAKLQPS